MATANQTITDENHLHFRQEEDRRDNNTAEGLLTSPNRVGSLQLHSCWSESLPSTEEKMVVTQEDW